MTVRFLTVRFQCGIWPARFTGAVRAIARSGAPLAYWPAVSFRRRIRRREAVPPIGGTASGTGYCRREVGGSGGIPNGMPQGTPMGVLAYRRPIGRRHFGAAGRRRPGMGGGAVCGRLLASFAFRPVGRRGIWSGGNGASYRRHGMVPAMAGTVYGGTVGGRGKAPTGPCGDAGGRPSVSCSRSIALFPACRPGNADLRFLNESGCEPTEPAVHNGGRRASARRPARSLGVIPNVPSSRVDLNTPHTAAASGGGSKAGMDVARPDEALQGRWGVLPRPSGKRRTAMAGRIRPAFLGGPKRGGRCRQIWGGHCRLDWGDVCRLLPGGHCRRTSWGIGCGAGAGAAGGGDRAPAVLRAGRAAGTWARDPEGNGVLRGRRLGSGKTTCATETLPGSLAYRISQLGSPIDDSPEPV